MEGFCRGCLIKYDDPMELLQYTEKNRRLFVYSTGLQVKRNDTFTFQLCKDCFLNMKQACKFKKNCRTSDKRFRNYLALKDIGDPVDFCTFLKNSDETFRFPMTSGSSTPATRKCRDDDNESTCTSIRNFMTDILQGEEMPDTEARIIREVIEEEADVLDDSLDSHWLQDDMSIDTDFRLDISFSPFSTPHSINNDHCYTPKQKEDQITFDTINTEKQTKILKDFTNAFKSDENIEEISFFVGAEEKTENFNILKELSPLSVDEIDGIRKTETDGLKNSENLKEISNLDIDEIDAMDISDNSNQNLCDFVIEKQEIINQKENIARDSTQNVKELCNFAMNEIDSIVNDKNNFLKRDESLKDLINDMGKPTNSDKTLKELINCLEINKIDAFEISDRKSNKNLKELCDFGLDNLSVEKAESKTNRTVQSLRELCDISLDSTGSIEKPASLTNKNNESLKELLDLSLNSFDDSAKSGRAHLSLNDFDDFPNSGSNAFKTSRNIQELCDFGIDELNENVKLERNLDLPSLSDVLEREKMDTPDFDLPKGVRSTHSQNDISNSSINIEALLKDKPCSIDKNLEKALMNTDNKEFSLDDILGPKAASGASTPTITNILFGEKLDTPDSKKIEDCIDVEIFEEFFQNDTKEFYIEDIKRGNGEFLSGEWKQNIDFNNDIEEKSKNIDMDVDFEFKVPADPIPDNYDTAAETKNEIKEYISDTDPNDKFDIKDLYCKLCDNKYSNSRALSVHFYKYHKIKIVKTKKNVKALTEPEKEVTVNISDMPPNENFDPKNSNCNLCKIKFDSVEELSVHVSRRHLKNTVKPEIRPLEFSDYDNKLDIQNSYCKLCDKKYKTGRALSLHFLKTHKLQIIVKPKPENSNKETMEYIQDVCPNDKFDIEKIYCKLCKRKFKTGKALSIHFSLSHNIKIVKPEYDRKANQNNLCNICGKEFEDSRNFSRHVKTCKVKGVEDVFKCEYCLQEFKTKFYLDKHLTSHTKTFKKNKPVGEEILCTICGAILHRKNNLILHMRRHNKDYSVKCEYCNKGFYRQADLNIHLRMHTGDTPFSCTFCPRLFARRDLLLRHLRQVHTLERPFECDYCGLKCVKKYDLIKHIQNKSCWNKLQSKIKRKKKSNKKDKAIIVTPMIKVENTKEEEKEEVVAVPKEDKEEVVAVTVLYANASYDTVKYQLPFLETERSN